MQLTNITCTGKPILSEESQKLSREIKDLKKDYTAAFSCSACSIAIAFITTILISIFASILPLFAILIISIFLVVFPIVSACIWLPSAIKNNTLSHELIEKKRLLDFNNINQHYKAQISSLEALVPSAVQQRRQKDTTNNTSMDKVDDTIIHQDNTTQPFTVQRRRQNVSTTISCNRVNIN